MQGLPPTGNSQALVLHAPKPKVPSLRIHYSLHVLFLKTMAKVDCSYSQEGVQADPEIL